MAGMWKLQDNEFKSAMIRMLEIKNTETKIKCL